MDGPRTQELRDTSTPSAGGLLDCDVEAVQVAEVHVAVEAVAGHGQHHLFELGAMTFRPTNSGLSKRLRREMKDPDGARDERMACEARVPWVESARLYSGAAMRQKAGWNWW
jgi:hypothetical protein